MTKEEAKRVRKKIWLGGLFTVVINLGLIALTVALIIWLIRSL